MSISLTDFGRRWFEQSVDSVIGWFEKGLDDGYRELSEIFFGTPTPNTDGTFVFGAPTNEPWIQIYDSLVGGEVMFISLLILLICVQARNTIRIFNIGSAFEARQARMSGWVGAVLIVTWYWLSVVVLYFVSGFTIALLPDIGALFDTISALLDLGFSNPALALLLTSIGGISMWVLYALLFLREMLLYVFVYGMPIGIAVAYGNVPIVSQIAKRLCLKFIPLAIMPLPIAILFRGYELLFSGDGTVLIPESAFLKSLIAVSLPLIAVIIVWKLFAYATPIVTRVARGTTRTAVTAGAVVGAGYLAGPVAGATAARWGPTAAVSQTILSKTRSRNTAPDSNSQQNAPMYRRTENDPRNN